MEKDIKNWYTSWFNTPFYHILYKDRDYGEAGMFMDNLTTFLELPEQAEILDLACGRGRHAKYLNDLGFRVTGVDLSPENIAFARQFENATLHFAEHNMCKPYPRLFDAVFNLFTSFGYFDKEENNLKTIQSIAQELKPGGFGVIDFMNVKNVEKHMVPFEEKRVDGIHFKIEKKIEGGYIIKDIRFSYEGKNFYYSEKVKALELSNFQHYFNISKLKLVHCLGDYHLNLFDEDHSERLILIFRA